MWNKILFLLGLLVVWVYTPSPKILEALTKRQIRIPHIWEAGVVPYTFSEEITENGKIRIKKAMATWSRATGLKFKPRGTEGSYLYIFAGSGCYSPIGKMGGPQFVSLPWGCQSQGTILHEIGHSLGLRHEHQRLKRDNYITIDWGQVEFLEAFNFWKLEDLEMDKFPYDKDSIMHYDSYDFSIGDKPVMLWQNGGLIYHFRQGNLLSEGDIKKIKYLYRKELK